MARSYGRTGSIKETSEELFCHRNTVVNRLHSLHEVIGLDLTVRSPGRPGPHRAEPVQRRRRVIL
ncbi:helix-turn-helix domain-containing protein [Pseudarthrobacter sp. So.54]